MNRTLGIAIAVAALVVVLLLGGTFFVVNQTQQALVLYFGKPVRVIQNPGLKVKIPFLEEALYVDSRILDYAPQSEEVITADQKRLVVDVFARYRIVDPLEFYQTVGSELGIRSRLDGILISSLRRVIGGVSFESLLSAQRDHIMRQIGDDANGAAKALGVNIIDVRIRRADLPEANAQAIYHRMQSERGREARQFRAEGAEAATRIRASAERERTVLLAEAQRKAEVLKGEGDAEATEVYARAFGRDPQFYEFYRSLEAYRQALGSNDTIVMSPSGEFFRFFNQAPGEMPAPAPAPAAPAGASK